MARGIDKHAELYAETMDSHSRQHCIDWLERKITEDQAVIDLLEPAHLEEYGPMFQRDIDRRKRLVKRLKSAAKKACTQDDSTIQ